MKKCLLHFLMVIFSLSASAQITYKSGSRNSFENINWPHYGISFKYPVDFQVLENNYDVFRARGDRFYFTLTPHKYYNRSARGLAEEAFRNSRILEAQHTASHFTLFNGFEGWQIMGNGKQNGKDVTYFLVGILDKAASAAYKLSMIYEKTNFNVGLSLCSEIKSGIRRMDSIVKETDPFFEPQPGYSSLTVRALYRKGIEAIEIKDYATAVTYLTEVIRKVPSFSKAYNPLGVAFINQGYYDEGIEACLQSIKMGIKYPETYYNLGLAYEMKGKFPEALQYYFKALYERPDYFLASEGVGYTYEKMDKVELAIEHFKKAARGGEKNAREWLTYRNISWEGYPVLDEVPWGDFMKKEEENTDRSIVMNENPVFVSDIDINLPRTKTSNPDAIAVVIGNSDYRKIKNVDYAVNDAKSIRKYLTNVLGFKEGNIFYMENATKGDFELFFGLKDFPYGKLYNAIKPGKSDVFVFYSGHGAPGLKDQKSYFVPVECDPQYVEIGGYSSNVFYENLSRLPAKEITIILDACFSGSALFRGISPIVIKEKEKINLPNAIIVSSSSEDEVSCWYEEQKHGLFTYFFLKAIHRKNADFNGDNKLTFDEILKYITDQSEGVPYYARRFYNIDQVPAMKGDYNNKVLIEY